MGNRPVALLDVRNVAQGQRESVGEAVADPDLVQARRKLTRVGRNQEQDGDWHRADVLEHQVEEVNS